jgi:hypothetical protein
LLASGTLHAREWFKDGRIGAGVDVAQQAGMPMASSCVKPIGCSLRDRVGA